MPRKEKQKKKVVSRFAEDLSGFFDPFVSFFLSAIFILHQTFFSPPPYSIFLHHFLIGLVGSFPTFIPFLLARPYPFTFSSADAGGMRSHFRSVTSLSIEKRKVLTFWKRSEEVRWVIWKSEAYLILFVLVLAVISVTLAHFFDRQMAARLFNMLTERVSQQAEIFALIMESILIFISSYFFFLYSLARFLKKNIDHIAAMDIEPWPADKPYGPAYFINTRRGGPIGG